MILNGRDYGRVFCASGALNLDGSGWWYHKYLPVLDLTGLTPVMKTTTRNPRLDPAKRLGSMALRADGKTPRDKLPDCIKVCWRKGVRRNGASAPILGRTHSQLTHRRLTN